MTIDVHAHYVPKGWPDLGDGMPWLRVGSEREAMIMIGDREFRRVFSECWDPQLRLADLDADHIDQQVVSPTPVFFSYARPADQAAKVSRIFNDLLLEMLDGNTSRLIPFAQVPLQDPDLACAELDRAMANGHKGVEIGNHIGDADLDSEGVVTFLQHAASVGAPVFVHPWDMPSSPRADRWMAEWLVGMPAETHLSILAMVLGGVFDRVPDTLRIAFAHGGGSFPMWLGRMDNAWRKRADVVKGASTFPPSSYVNRFFVDSVVFDEAALQLLLGTMGASQVVVGSDYPYPFGERPIAQVVRNAALDEHTRSLILSLNAKRFLFASE